jgi:uncharacterized membrane protein
VDGGLLWLNILLLLGISFIPFPTGFIGEYPWNGTALALFALALMLAGVAFNLMWRRALRKGLFHVQTDRDLVHRAIRRGMVGPLFYALAAAIALVFPLGSWLLFAGIPIYYSMSGGRARPGESQREENPA